MDFYQDKEAAKEQRSATQKIAAFNLEESMKAKLNKHEETPVVPVRNMEEEKYCQEMHIQSCMRGGGKDEDLKCV